MDGYIMKLRLGTPAVNEAQIETQVTNVVVSVYLSIFLVH